VRNAGKNGISPGTCFNIHCDHIDQSVFCKGFQRVGTGAVCIELYGISKIFYILKKRAKGRGEGRLASGDAHAVENPMAFFQERENFFSGIFRLVFRAYHKSAVLAEGTAEIAAA